MNGNTNPATASPPPLTELAASIRESSRSRRCAVLLPVLDETEALSCHLNRLALQTTDDFDVIIVHSPALDLSKVKCRYRFGLVFITERQPCGLSSAFYIAQRYALEKGYRTVIQADVDCFPESPTLVTKLSAAAASEADAIFFPLQAGWPLLSAMNWYTAMNRSVLERSGLVYRPFYYGAEDGEHYHRIVSCGIGVKRLCSVSVSHGLRKIFNPPGERATRILYFLRNYTATALVYPPILLMLLHYLCPFAFFNSFRALKRMCMLGHVVRDILFLRMFRNDTFHGFRYFDFVETDASDPLHKGADTKVIIVESHLDAEDHHALLERLDDAGIACRVLRLGGPASLISLFSEVLSSVLRYENLVMATRPYAAFNPFALIAKNLYYFDGVSMYALSHERSFLIRLARGAISTILYAFLVAFFIPLAALSRFRLAGSLRQYGTKNLHGRT